jgi:hypothetical protein
MDENIQKCVDSSEKAKLLAEKKFINESLENMTNLYNNCFKETGLVENSDKSKTMFENYNKEFTEVFKKAEKISIDLEESVNKKFMDDNSILEYINNFKDYLATLSTTEICLVMNIFISVFILTCLVSIIFAVYGNFLIDKLSLEKKYPKLSKIISLRVKVQHFYVISNTLFILTALILMFYVNIMTLIYS